MLIAHPAFADLWYEHYSRAEQALVDQDWTLAVQEINEALEKKGDSGARVRSYGMRVVAYFPYFKLGIAYYHLGQFDAALQAFETEERLGAIAASASASEELARYRGLVQAAQAAAVAEQQQRIDQIVEQSLSDARELQVRGLLDEAVTAVDRALAVAPDDVAAQDIMRDLRQQLVAREREQVRNQQAANLLENGRELLREQRYSEASSLFRQALLLNPSQETQALLDAAQRNLRAELQAGRAAVAAGLEEVRALESAGQIDAALTQLQSLLALEPASQEVLAIQDRLLRAQQELADATARQAAIDELLAEGETRFDNGAVEAALSAANRVLALDPGNAEALEQVARAYGVISRRLLGTAARENIPPAIRFADLRQESDDGDLVQTVSAPDFRLTGVVIDNTPVSVVFFGSDNTQIDATVDSQPLGEYYLTEFSVQATLPPGRSTFRLVATDAENLTTSSEYVVHYARPFVRTPLFYGLLIGGVVLAGGALLWRRSRRRRQLRQRRFNPYVAGAPILDDNMFFGRRELVDRILQTIHNNNLLMYGERRIGKTSIQHQLKKRLRELRDPLYEFHPVYIDLQGTSETRFFQTIAEEIFHELAPVLDCQKPGGDISGDYSYRDFVRDIHAVLKTLKQRTSKKVKLVLLIDEVDVLNEYDPRINQRLRSLFMKSFAENLAAVVSGVDIKKEWEGEGSPWYNFFEEIEVEPLGTHEAQELIERPIRGLFRLDDGAAERIIALSDGKPYLIQKLCVALVTRLHEQRRRRITIADVEAVSRPGGA